MPELYIITDVLTNSAAKLKYEGNERSKKIGQLKLIQHRDS